MTENINMRRGVTVPSPLSWLSTKKSNGTEEFVTSGSLGSSILPETQFVGTLLHTDTTQVLSAGLPFPLGERPERGQCLTSNTLHGSTLDFSSRLSPEVFLTREYFCKIVGVLNQSFP